MLLSHLLLVAILVLSVYSQLIMKSRALVHSSGSSSSADYLQYLIGMATDWRVLSAAGVTFPVVFVGCWRCNAASSDMHFHSWRCHSC